jgi:hypothetical protein
MRLMAHFFRAYPLHTALMLAALFSSGIVKGIGVSALLPLLNIALGAAASTELVAPGTEVQSNLERVVSACNLPDIRDGCAGQVRLDAALERKA